MKFTPEEISLCKQVAEKHRKSIEYGDWFLDPNVMEQYQARLCTYFGKDAFGEIYHAFTPLWTISDCLEFLQEKISFVELWKGERNLLWFCRLKNLKKAKRWQSGKTPLEACLKAVLAVLEEGK